MTTEYRIAQLQTINPLDLRVGDLLAHRGAPGSGIFTARRITWVQEGTRSAFFKCRTVRYTQAGLTNPLTGYEYESTQPEQLPLHIVRREATS